MQLKIEGYPLDSPSYHILYSVAWKLKNTHVISWNLNLNIVMSKIAGNIFSDSDGRKDSFALDVRARNLLNLRFVSVQEMSAPSIGYGWNDIPSIAYSIARLVSCDLVGCQSKEWSQCSWLEEDLGIGQLRNSMAYAA